MTRLRAEVPATPQASQQPDGSVTNPVIRWDATVNATTIIVANVDTARIDLPAFAEACQQQTIQIEIDVPFSWTHGLLRLQSPKRIVGDLPTALGLPESIKLGEPVRVGERFLYALTMRANGAIELGIDDSTITKHRPALADAAAACLPGVPLRAVIVPPDYLRQIYRDLLPDLPSQLGGGSTALLTEGFQWAALSWDPAGSATLEISSASAGDAQALAERLPIMIRSLAGRFSATAPSADTLATLPIEVDGERIVVRIETAQLVEWFSSS